MDSKQSNFVQSVKPFRWPPTTCSSVACSFPAQVLRGKPYMSTRLRLFLLKRE